MAEELGTIRGSIRLDVKQAVEAYTAARQEHLSTVSALGAGSGAISAVGASFLAAGTAAAAGIMTAVGAAAEFERKLDFFAAVSGATQAEYQAISDKALQLGKDTIYSAGEVADAFIELGKSGVDLRDILDGIGEAVTNLGAAADMPLEQAAIGLTTVLNTFKLSADEAVNVVDQLAGAANASSIDVQDLMVTMAFAGASAATAGIKFEDMNAAIAYLGKVGVRGSRAGTGLRQMFDKLLAPTTSGAKALLELGINAEDGSSKLFNLDGTLRPIPEILDTLNGALDGMAENEKIDILGQIFPVTSMPTILNLISGGSKALNELNREIELTSAADVAGQRLDNLSGDIEYLSGELETLAIAMGNTMQGPARSFIQMLERLVMGLNRMSPEMMSVVMMTAAVGAAILMAVGILGLFAGQILNIIKLGYELKDAISFLNGLRSSAGALGAVLRGLPIVGLIALIAALVAGLIYLFAQTEQGQQVWANLVEIFNRVMTTIQPLIDMLQTTFLNALDRLAPAAAQVGEVLGGVLMVALDALVPIITTLAEILAGVLIVALNIIVPVISFLADLLIGPFGAGLMIAAAAIGAIVLAVKLWTAAQWLLNIALNANPISLIIMAVVALIGVIVWLATQTTFFQDLWANVSSFLMSTWEAISDFFISVWTAISDWFIGLWETVSGFVISVWENIASFFTTVFGEIGNFFRDVWQGLVDFLTPIFTTIYTIIKFFVEMWINIFLVLAAVFVTIWNAISTVFTTVWNAIVEFITPIIEFIAMIIGTTIAIIAETWNAIWQGIVDFFTSVWNAIIEFITPIIEFLVTYITEYIQMVSDIWNDIWSAISSFFTDLWNGIVNFIGPIVATLFSVISDVITNVQNTWNSIWSAIGSFLEDIWNNIVNAVTTAVDTVFSIIGSIHDTIMGFFDGVASWLFGVGEDIIQGMIDGIKSMFSGIVDAITGVVNGAIDWAKGVLGIKSPSRVFMAIGNDTILGMINGVQQMARPLEKSFGMIEDSMEQFYDQVYAAREFDVMMNLESQMATTQVHTLETKFDDLSDQLTEIAEKPRFNIEKYETNNPAPEPASDSLPKNIRKVVHVLGD